MDASDRADAINEVKILSSFDHPNVVQYFDSFLDGHTLNIVMEYCENGDLSQLLKRRGGNLLDEKEVVRMLTQMCLGLYRKLRSSLCPLLSTFKTF